MKLRLRQGRKGEAIEVETAKFVMTIITVVVAIFLVTIVLMQSGKSAGLSGAIAGGSNADSFLSKNKKNRFDAKLARLTKWIAIAFMILSMIVCLM